MRVSQPSSHKTYFTLSRCSIVRDRKSYWHATLRIVGEKTFTRTIRKVVPNLITILKTSTHPQTVSRKFFRTTELSSSPHQRPKEMTSSPSARNSYGMNLNSQTPTSTSSVRMQMSDSWSIFRNIHRNTVQSSMKSAGVRKEQEGGTCQRKPSNGSIRTPAM